MRKNLILAIFCWALSLSAWALVVPAGKAATVESVIGKVTADQGQGFTALKLGQDLKAGTTVKTGTNGRLALRLPDGSGARMAPNTEMTLRDEKVRKGIFTRLLMGTVRFMVAKQAKDSTFETEVPNAVAAVKGTDPEYGTDGKNTTAKVFSSGNPVALLFTDKSTGKEAEVKAGEKLVFDGEGFKLEKMDEADKEESEKNYQGLPPAGKDDGTGGGSGGEGQGAGAGQGDGSTGSGDSATTGDESEAAMKEAMEGIYLDGFLERDDRTGDIFSGKIIFDRFGDRVQVSHVITKTDESSVTIGSYSQRETGPNAGVSYAIESATFNQPLPADWGRVYLSKITDAFYQDGTGYPYFWRTNMNFIAGNPWGDFVNVATAFEQPYTAGTSPSGALFQGYTQDIYVNGMLMQTTNFALASASSPVGHSYQGNPGTNSIWTNTAQQFENGWRFSYSNDNPSSPKGSPVFLTQDIHFLDDKGNVLQHPTYLGTPAVIGDVFKNFDANVEIAFNSPYFNGNSIDVLFLPGFFDEYRMISHPYQGNPLPCQLC